MAERTYTMRWLTLEDIKDQVRIEYDDTTQDNLLRRYGATAENFTLNWLQRTEDELKAMNDADTSQVPEDIVSACLLLVCSYYDKRSTWAVSNDKDVFNQFEALVMPYRKATYSSEPNGNN